MYNHADFVIRSLFCFVLWDGFSVSYFPSELVTIINAIKTLRSAGAQSDSACAVTPPAVTFTNELISAIVLPVLLEHNNKDLAMIFTKLLSSDAKHFEMSSTQWLAWVSRRTALSCCMLISLSLLLVRSIHFDFWVEIWTFFWHVWSRLNKDTDEEMQKPFVKIKQQLVLFLFFRQLKNKISTWTQ